MYIHAINERAVDSIAGIVYNVDIGFVFVNRYWVMEELIVHYLLLSFH